MNAIMSKGSAALARLSQCRFVRCGPWALPLHALFSRDLIWWGSSKHCCEL